MFRFKIRKRYNHERLSFRLTNLPRFALYARQEIKTWLFGENARRLSRFQSGSENTGRQTTVRFSKERGKADAQQSIETTVDTFKKAGLAEEDAEAEEKQAMLARLLLEKVKSLGEPDSSIVIQKYFYNRSSAEIAKLLGMNPAGVRMRCRRAISRLKTIIDIKDLEM